MKVLHYIPSAKAAAGSYVSDYIVGVVKSMSERAEVHVLTSAGGARLGNSEMHVWRPGLLPFYTGRRRLRRLLSALKPDVVHIHSCWSFYAAILSGECARMRIPTVITPGRRLEPWHYSHRYFLSKLPKYILFQRKMVVRAAALHAVCAQEASDLAAFCWHPRLRAKHSLNSRVVETNIFDTPVSRGAPLVADELLKLYQKAVDSAPFPMMSADELLAEDWLIMTGAADGSRQTSVPGDVLSVMNTLDGKAWRRIFLHSADQGVLDFVRRGLGVAGLSVPPLAVDKVDRFTDGLNDRAAEKRLPGRSKLSRLSSDGELSGRELDICTQFVSVMMKARKACVSRADFVGLCRALRLGGYDEDAVEAKVRSLGVSRDAAGLLQVLKERYGLGEGFMFSEPSDGRAAGKFKVKLFKSDIQ